MMESTSAFRLERLSVEAALREGAELPWAYVRSLSGFSLGAVPEELPPREELLELRFFSPAEEVRLFHDGEELRALRLTDSPEGDFEDRGYELRGGFGETLTVRRYLDYDEDGQLFVAAVRLCGWKGGKENG